MACSQLLATLLAERARSAARSKRERCDAFQAGDEGPFRARVMGERQNAAFNSVSTFLGINLCPENLFVVPATARDAAPLGGDHHPSSCHVNA